MERTINTKFYTFNQNNSGGYFIENDVVAHYLIVEASNAKEAVEKMQDITTNYSEYCSCCGERWSSWLDDEDGTEEPMVFDTKIKEQEPENKWFGNSTIIYYYDGTIEKLWYKKEVK
jgi:hypothetical protein